MKMKLEKNKFYKTEIVRKGRHLEYDFLVKEIKNKEYKVQTKEGETLHFEDKEIKYKKEIPPFPIKKEIHIFRTKGTRTNLKPHPTPDL